MDSSRNNFKFTIYALVLILFFIGAFILGYLLEKKEIYKKEEEEEYQQQPVVDKSVKPLVLDSNIPINKLVYPSGTHVEYRLEGRFVEGPDVKHVFADYRLQGEFILKGDPLERKIEVVLGKDAGGINFGVFEGTFSARSVWTSILNRQVPEKLKEGEEMRLQVIVGVDEVEAIEKIIDKMYAEYDSNDFKLEIPEDFVIYAQGLGVVR